jgi:hypothetical protein
MSTDTATGDTTYLPPGPPLLVDTRRVFSTSHDLASRMPEYLRSNQSRTTWDGKGRAQLFAVANLVAYHVARSVGGPLADRVLCAQLESLVTATRGDDVARLALDPFLNRLRLAAMVGEVDAALAGVDECLTTEVGVAGDSRPTDGLRYGIELFAGPDRIQLHDLLRTERLLILWRSGRLSALPSRTAGRLVAEYGAHFAMLRAEVDLRLRLARGAPPPYALVPGDTLKRAMHRALVYLDQPDPGQQDDLLVEVVRRGLEQLDVMTFVCPSTAHLWARTALRWVAPRVPDHEPTARRAMALAQARVTAIAHSTLDSVVGPPSTSDAHRATVVGVEHAHQIIDLLQRASVADSEVTAHVR